MIHPQGQRAKILLVDDSPTNLMLLGEILSPDYDVLVATSGETAVGIARNSEPPDLILLDVKMPGMDGYATCQLLKEDANTRNIPIIFVTAVEGSQAETRGFELGAVDYITKPYSTPVVLARVRTHMALKKHSELLESLAFIDGLTGIANRRQFDQQLEKEWSRMMRQNAPLSLLIIDIDHFKTFNDQYGHGAGDDCLRLVARTIAGIIKRPGDLAARYGGEEFVVILPGTDEMGAHSVAESMRSAVDKLVIPHAGSPLTDHVTISIGAASHIPQRQGNYQDLINSADRALYRAKSAGRNQIFVEPSSNGETPATI
jgi:diguanylate cyclase (GGDEF)-like protein